MSSAPRFSHRVEWAGNQPISRLMHLALARPELISLAAGFVDQQSLPVDGARQAIETVLGDRQVARAALQYGTTPGLPELREAVLARLLSADGQTAAEARLSADQVVMTAGSNQLLHIVSEVLLDQGDIVLCAAPTYFVYLGVLAGLGARAIGIAADEHGLIPEALDAELARLAAAGLIERVKALYVTSYYDNPSNVTLPADRRWAIVEIVKRHSARGPIYIIDDAAYRQLRYGPDDVPSLRSFDESGDTVIVAETFSKSFSPGIRVGWGVLPTALVDPVCELKGNLDFGSASFNQHVMAAVLRQGLFEPHVETLRRQYAAKMQAMLEAADDHLTGIEGVSWTEAPRRAVCVAAIARVARRGHRRRVVSAGAGSGRFVCAGGILFSGRRRAAGQPYDSLELWRAIGTAAPKRSGGTGKGDSQPGGPALVADHRSPGMAGDLCNSSTVICCGSSCRTC